MRDAKLAKAALDTHGAMPKYEKAKGDVQKGEARWFKDSGGERYLQYKDGRTYHQELHGRLRETGLKQLATLGTTEKKAILIDSHLIDFKAFGHRFKAIKAGEKVLVGREGAIGKYAGEQKDAMRERHMTEGKGGMLTRANDAARNAVLTKMEGWREATLQESIRARFSTLMETRAMRSEASQKLEAKVKAGDDLQKSLTPAPTLTENVRPSHILDMGAEQQHTPQPRVRM